MVYYYYVSYWVHFALSNRLRLLPNFIFLPLFSVVDLETSNGLMTAARWLMLLNSLLMVAGVEHAKLNIGVNLCLLVLRARGSMVLHRYRIMSAPGILRSTPSVHISGWRHRNVLSIA